MALFTRNRNAAPATTGTVLETDPALAALTGDYAIDPAHTSIGFVARHAMVTNVRGSFLEHEGTLHLDGSAPARSHVALDVKIASIDTGSKDRDGHLLSADFLDVEEFPRMTFRSTAVEQADGDEYRVTGELTIKDVTRPLTIDLTFTGAATDPFGNERVGFEGSAQILRSDWGLTWNATLETGGVLVSDKIKLTFDISAIKSAPQA
ncbi:YceI family protein [Streptomyces sp. H27-D2]|uniref:YceI family protein n=1 Tax=Streptomyces sp. H27-D2 TaxID=3046304 RepID=UPI002DBDA018|nr:YceI family protein [Streptomyces sp. H27-D2]MEC4017252.1 YceI family protein [Streptomyces sp. H27-D2]